MFDFSFCSLGSIPLDLDLIGLEMGPSSNIDFKVTEKILVYSQCSQLRIPAESKRNLALPEGYNYLVQNTAISIPRKRNMLECGREFGYSLLFIIPHWPYILMVP